MTPCMLHRKPILPLRDVLAIISIMATQESTMKHISAKDAKNGFGLLLDTARAEPVVIEKHGRAVVVVLSIEEYDRLTSKDSNPKQSVVHNREET